MVHSHVWSVREADCVTAQACPSHHCVPQDTTVLQGPLLLDPVLQSVLVCQYVCSVMCVNVGAMSMQLLVLVLQSYSRLCLISLPVSCISYFGTS